MVAFGRADPLLMRLRLPIASMARKEGWRELYIHLGSYYRLEEGFYVQLRFILIVTVMSRFLRGLGGWVDHSLGSFKVGVVHLIAAIVS